MSKISKFRSGPFIVFAVAVVLTLSGCENGMLGTISENVRIATGSPGIAVEFEGSTIEPGSTVTLGNVLEGYTGTFDFTIRNVGVGPLSLTGSPRVAIAGPDQALFTENVGLPESVTSSSTFQLQFQPTASTGRREATITILSDDPLNESFSFGIRGLVPWKLTSKTRVASAQFGFSTAIADQTGEIFVGAWTEDNSSGRVYRYFYDWNDGQFKYGGAAGAQSFEQPSDSSSGDFYGRSIAVDNSSFIAVGANGHSNNTGKVYLYDWIGFKYDDTASLTASNAAEDDYFGTSVDYSLGAEADYVIVGAPQTGAATGKAYIYYEDDYKDRKWLSEALLMPSEIGGQSFGASVAIAGDLALVGAPRRNGGTGGVYAFQRTGSIAENTWTEIDIIEPDGLTSSSKLGFKVVSDGTNAAFGVANDDTVFVYRFSGGSWHHVQTISPGRSEGFGSSVDLEGGYLVVGASGNDDREDNAGRIYLYRWSDGQFYLEASYAPEDLGRSDRFGGSVAVSGQVSLADNRRFVVGGAALNNVDSLTQDAGAAYAFEF